MRWLLNNINGFLFVVGFALLSAGIAAWSPPAAAVVAGVVLMALGLWPYITIRKPSRGERTA
jgi:hypothetical protein